MTERMKHMYVDNKELSRAMQEFYETVTQSKVEGKPLPPIPPYIAKCVLLIATHTAMRPNFSAYTYKEEMIGDAIENCIKYLHNYDPNISTNAFGYIGRICWWAFLRRIKLEKNEHNGRISMIHNMDMTSFFDVAEQDTDEDFKNQFIEFLREHSINEDHLYQPHAKKESKKQKVEDNNFLEIMFEEDSKDE